jgi:hypothetical protein
MNIVNFLKKNLKFALLACDLIVILLLFLYVDKTLALGFGLGSLFAMSSKV